MECLILKNEPAGEADRLVTVMLSSGKRRRAIVRSASLMSSRVRAGVIPLSISDVSFVAGRRHWLLRNAVPLMTFPVFSNSFQIRSATALFAELASSEKHPEEDRELYAVLVRTLRDLHTAVLYGEGTLSLAKRTMAAWLRTLRALGLAPILDRCVNCGSTDQIIAVSVSSSGALCAPCVDSSSDRHIISSRAVAALALRRVPDGGEDVARLMRFLAYFTAWHFPELGPYAHWVSRAVLSAPASPRMV